MFRDSSAARQHVRGHGRHAGNGVSMQWRSATGGQCGSSTISSVAAPTASNPSG